MRSGPTFNFRQRQNFFSNYFNGFCCKTIFSLSILTACCGQAIFSRICAYSHILYALDFLLLLLRKIFSQILWKIGSCHNFDTIPSHTEKRTFQTQILTWKYDLLPCMSVDSWTHEKHHKTTFIDKTFSVENHPQSFFTPINF